MAKHCTCDVCDKLLDYVTSIQDREGKILMPLKNITVNTVIILKIVTSSGINNVCFSCLVEGINRQILKREEVIREFKKSE